MSDPTTHDLEIYEALAEVAPDSLMIASRVTPVAPVAGRPASDVVETGRLVRYNRVVMLTVPAVPPLRGDIIVKILGDAELAAVEYGNLIDALRRDGWDVREPDPWEVTDPLAPDAKAPF